MKNLKDFQENKAVLAVKGGADGRKETHSTHHTDTQNILTGVCDTRIKEYPDVEGKGLVGTGETCTQEVPC